MHQTLKTALRNSAAIAVLATSASPLTASEKTTNSQAEKNDSIASNTAKLPSIVVTNDLNVGMLPMNWITSSFNELLSPAGSYRFLTINGPVRVTDKAENIEKLAHRFRELQQSPALVEVSIKFKGSDRVMVQRYPSEPPILSYEYPIPRNYDPGVIYPNRNGFTIIPPRPKDFEKRNYGPGTIVNLSPSGYRTLNHEVRLSESQTRNFLLSSSSTSTGIGNYSIIALQPKAANPSKLRELALNCKAIASTEPAWTEVSAEIAIRPVLDNSGGVLAIITPLISLPIPDSKIPRRIALSPYEFKVPCYRFSSGSFTAPIDASFIRIFLGKDKIPEGLDTTIEIGIKTQYLGGIKK